MNEIRFQIREDKNIIGMMELVSDIFIDDKNLIDILKEYELPFAKKGGNESLAGSYRALLPSDLFSNLTMCKNSENKKVAVLDCPCGCDGCWTFMVRVIETDEYIIWTDFEQIHRSKDSKNHWDYSNLSDLRFNKTDYLIQVETLKQ